MRWFAAIVITTFVPRRTRMASAGASVRFATDRPLRVALHGPLMPAETWAGWSSVISAATTVTPTPARLAARTRPPRRLTRVTRQRAERFAPDRQRRGQRPEESQAT